MNSIFETLTGELRAKLLRRRQDHRQPNFACNSIRPSFNKPRKRCNSNDANSIFEQAVGELHAKLMIDSHNWATYSNPGPGRGAGGRRQGQGGLRDDAPRPSAHRAPLVWRAPAGPNGLAAVPVGGGGAWPGFEATRRAKLAARTASGRAGHAAAGDQAALRTPAAPQATTTRPPRYAKGAGTEVPAPCRLTQPLPRRGSGRMTVSPGDGDASTGTCRQRRPLPGQPRRSGRRSRCGRGPASAWWPGRRARRNRSSRR